MSSHAGTNSNENEVPHGKAKFNRGTLSWLLAVIVVFAVAWGSNELIPLMVMYRENVDPVPVSIDLLLLVYALGIASALLISGPISDRIDRKPAMLVAPMLSILGSALIALGETTVSLIPTGRFISGSAVGIVMAVGGSWVKGLSDPRFDLETKPISGAKRQSMALTLGFGLGAGIAGALAQFMSLPGQLVYIIYILISTPTVFGLSAVPETRQSPHLGGSNAPREIAWESLRTPSVTNRRFLPVAVMGAPWVFGVAGVAYAIIPSLLQDHVSQPVFYSTMVTLFALLCGFGIQQTGPRLVTEYNARGSSTAVGIVVIGMGLTARISANLTAVTVFIVALMLSAGYGLSMFIGLNEAQYIASPRDVARPIGIFYCLTYISFAFPAVLTKLSESVFWMTYPATLGGGMVIATLMSLVTLFNSTVNLPQRAGQFRIPRKTNQPR